MSNPLVSIITPCYNAEKYLSCFFDSILSQTYKKLEIIFVNDGSTDNTEKIALSYKEKFEQNSINFVYISQENAGQAAALNNGLRSFRGEYITWLDSDDEILPDFIKAKVEYMEFHRGCQYCYGKAICVYEDSPENIINEYGKRNVEKDDKLSFFKDILYVNNVFFTGYFARSSAINYVVPKNGIYVGRGGQNAQLLLPLSWYYGEPDYVENSVYKYYIRKSSHSHSQNTSEKVIEQLCNYENILINTIVNINDKRALNYIDDVKKYYSKLRFGNAIDTKNAKLIEKYYKELKVDNRSLKDFLLYIKYSKFNFLLKD